MEPDSTAKLAYVISSHGFGHGARSCAVIDALQRRAPEISIEIWSAVPQWFFADSLRRPVPIHHEVTDLGLVQRNALDEDLAATVRQLRDWVPSPERTVRRLVTAFRQRGISHVVADISPLGLDVAKAGGWPAALVENFTWDWIYRGYLDSEPAFSEHIPSLQESFAGAELRLQVEPFCAPHPQGVRCAPVSREPRNRRHEVRRRLGIPHDAAMVLVTMGGIEWDYSALNERLEQAADGPWLVIPGSSDKPRRQGHIVRLPHRSDFYHPDLMHAADGVLGKLGYSTIAEVWSAGVPFAYIPRGRFPESPPLEAWVDAQLPSLRIAPQRFVAGDWLDDLPRLVELPRRPAGVTVESGADQAAQHLRRWISGQRRAA